jgi:hypothetical protein
VKTRIVARFLDGRVLKGTTADFNPDRPIFHVVTQAVSGQPAAPVEVVVAHLKALFFVKHFEGDAAYNESKAFAPTARTQGKRVKVEFKDGEVIVGTTMGYQADRPGFFLSPVDPRSNNDRCFVVLAAVKSTTFL